MKAKPIAALIRKLDQVFSQYVRRSAADMSGLVRCVTCGKSQPWKEMHAGHYIRRQHMATRWDIRNVHPQCAGCNTFNFGALDEYTVYLDRLYGPSAREELLHLKRSTVKWSRSELEDRISHYGKLVRQLEAP